MKPIKKIYLLVILVTIALTSCTKEEDIARKHVVNKRVEQEPEQQEKGRFDTVPFKWDYESRPSSREFFIGLKSVKVMTPFRSEMPDFEFSHTEFTLLDHLNIYPGAAYKEKDLDLLQSDITKEKNPIRLVYDFPDPYLDIVEDMDYYNYRMSYKSAINSEEYHSTFKSGERTDYSLTEYSSTEDLKKAFGAEVKVALAFSAKVSASLSSHTASKRSKLIARIINRRFSVVMATPKERTGFFVDKSFNSNESWQNDVPVYIKSLTYGRYAYVSIQSDASFSEVKKAFEAGFKAGFVKGHLEYNEESVKTLSSSVITVMAFPDVSDKSYISSSIESLEALFKTNHSVGSSLPIFYQACYVADNKFVQHVQTIPKEVTVIGNKPSRGNGSSTRGPGGPSRGSGSSTRGPGGAGRESSASMQHSSSDGDYSTRTRD